MISASALQPPQQQFLPEQCGLYVTCLKALLAAAAAGSRTPTTQLLLAIAGLAQQLQGVSVAAAGAAAEDGSAVGSPAGKLLGSLQQLATDNAFSTGSSSSSGSSSREDGHTNTGGIGTRGAGTVAAAAGGADDALLLLYGRMMFTAGQVLIRGLEQQGAAAAHTERDEVPGMLVLLLGCVTAVGPALQQAAATMHNVCSSSSSNSSSSSSSNKAVAAEQSLLNLLQHQQKLKSTLASAVYGSSGSSTTAEAAARAAGAREVSEALSALADTAQQLVDLGSGICVHLAAGQHWCCANPGCTNLADALERQLVAGKGTVCSACRGVAAVWACLQQGLLQGRAQAGVRTVQAAQEPAGAGAPAVRGGGVGGKGSRSGSGTAPHWQCGLAQLGLARTAAGVRLRAA
jgi:hypothetical protein